MSSAGTVRHEQTLHNLTADRDAKLAPDPKSFADHEKTHKLEAGVSSAIYKPPGVNKRALKLEDFVYFALSQRISDRKADGST